MFGTTDDRQRPLRARAGPPHRGGPGVRSAEWTFRSATWQALLVKQRAARENLPVATVKCVFIGKGAE